MKPNSLWPKNLGQSTQNPSWTDFCWMICADDPPVRDYYSTIQVAAALVSPPLESAIMGNRFSIQPVSFIRVGVFSLGLQRLMLYPGRQMKKFKLLLIRFIRLVNRHPIPLALVLFDRPRSLFSLSRFLQVFRISNSSVNELQLRPLLVPGAKLLQSTLELHFLWFGNDAGDMAIWAGSLESQVTGTTVTDETTFNAIRNLDFADGAKLVETLLNYVPLTTYTYRVIDFGKIWIHSWCFSISILFLSPLVVVSTPCLAGFACQLFIFSWFSLYFHFSWFSFAFRLWIWCSRFLQEERRVVLQGRTMNEETIRTQFFGFFCFVLLIQLHVFLPILMGPGSSRPRWRCLRDLDSFFKAGLANAKTICEQP